MSHSKWIQANDESGGKMLNECERRAMNYTGVLSLEAREQAQA